IGAKMSSRVTIGKKFGLSSAALVFLTVLLGGASVYSIDTIHRGLQSIAGYSLPGVASVSAVEGDFQAYRGNAWKHMAAADPALLPAVEQRMEELKSKIQSDLQTYEKSIVQPENRVLYGKIGPPLERYLQAWESILPLSRAMKKKEAFDWY